jgi:acyl carrier protein
MNTAAARQLLAQLLARIAPEVAFDELPDDLDIRTAADLDSMDFLNLVTALHNETGLDVPERDYPALSTIRGFAEYVSGATGHASAKR